MSPLVRRLALVALGIFILYVGPGYYVTGTAGIALLVIATVAVLVAVDRYSSAREARPKSDSDLYQTAANALRQANVVRALGFGAVGLFYLLGNTPSFSRWWGLLPLAYACYSVYRIWNPTLPRNKTGDRSLDVELDKIDELGLRDPQAAEAAMDRLFANREVQEEQELTRLRAAAKSDVKAAKALCDRLRKQLTPASVVRQYKKQLAHEPGISLFLETVEERDAATRIEIADLETRIKLLS